MISPVVRMNWSTSLPVHTVAFSRWCVCRATCAAEEPVLQVIPSEGGQLTGSGAGCERQVKHCMVLTRCPLARHPVARQLSDDLSGRADELEHFAAGPHGGFLPLVRVPLDVRCWVPA